MQVRTRQLTGTAITWDGSNTAGLAELAGDRFEGVYESSALIRNSDGDLVHVRPGWTVIRWDGVPGVGVSSPGAFRALTEPAGTPET